MSVRIFERNVSELQFMKTALDLRRNIVFWLKKEMHFATRNNPLWLIEDVRSRILDALERLISSLVEANSHFPCGENAIRNRAFFQTAAIAAAKLVSIEMTYAVDTLDINPDIVASFIEECTKEIDLIKGWKRKNREIYEKWKKKNSKIDGETVKAASSTNFCNANSNGNANNNSASNSNGVRP